jgi:hypothetical protein
MLGTDEITLNGNIQLRALKHEVVYCKNALQQIQIYTSILYRYQKAIYSETKAPSSLERQNLGHLFRDLAPAVWCIPRLG